MNNPQWLELPMSRTKFHGHIDVRAIEVELMIIPFLPFSHARSQLSPFMRKNVLTEYASCKDADKTANLNILVSLLVIRLYCICYMYCLNILSADNVGIN